ncbi:MAG: HEAT repeat domain-containing protein [Planctomycetes bacterium]|nr:HEAT repeat domain-containing protein [Planctomycetota bacterium]
MPDSLTLLDAVTLIRQRKADDVSAEELAGLRACFLSNPLLASMAGGAEAIERYIAEVEASLQRQAAAAATASTAAPPGVSEAKPRNFRRIAELSLYTTLVLAAAMGLYLFIPQDTPPTAPAKTAAVVDPKSTAKLSPKDNSNSNAGSKPAKPDAPAKPADKKKDNGPSSPDNEPNDAPKPAAELDGPNFWRGWRMTLAPDVKVEKKTEWDRTDPSNPEPASALLVRSGPLTLTRDLIVEPDIRWLMVHVRPNTVAAQPGQIVVAIDGKEAANAGIGTGQSDWPLYVALSDSQGTQRKIEITFAPSHPKQEITFWNVQLVPSQKRKPQPESPLIAALRSGDAAARVQGATAAGNVVDPYVTHALVAALKDPQREVRKAAAASLAKYNDGASRFVAEALVAALSDSDQEVRKTAATSLMAFSAGPNPVGAAGLTGAINDRDPEVRKTAASAMMSYQAETTWEVLRKALLEHPDFDLRLQIAQQLTGQKDLKTVAALSELLSSPDDRLRLAAVNALGQVPNPATTARLVQALNDPEPSVRRAAAAALVQRIDPTAEAALLAAATSHPDGLIRRTVLTSLRNRASALPLPAIQEALKSPDDQLRGLIPWTLLNVADPQSFVLLGQLLNDADPQVRNQAAEVLIRKRGEQADEILLKAILTHPDTTVRSIALTRFFTLSPYTPRAIDAIRESIKSPVASLRYNSLVALDGIRRSMIERAKQTGRSTQVAEVQKALAASPGPEILAMVKSLLDDPDPLVREGAANSMMNDATQAASPIVFEVMAKSQDVLYRRRAATRFANSELIVPTAEYKEPLLALLKDPDPETRRWALKSLSRLPSPETKAILEQHVDDPSFMVREIAAVALGKNPATVSDAALLSQEAKAIAVQDVPFLAGLLQSPRASIRQAAATQLAASPDPAAETIMLQTLESHGDLCVRRTAATRFATQFPTPKVLGPARAALSSPDVPLRVDTLLALGKVPNPSPEFFSLIAPLAADPDKNVRLAAATALAQNPNPGAEEIAIRLIHSDTDPRMLLQAASRLGYMPSARGIETLKPLLSHCDPSVAITAINGINKLKDPSVVPILAMALSNAAPSAQQHAVAVLAGRTEPAIEGIMLGALAAHPDVAVRRVALSWCQQHPKPQTVAAIAAAVRHDDDQLRIAALHALAQNPAVAATASIVELVSDPVHEVRMAAASLLLGRRDTEAQAAAMRLLATSGDIEVRRLMATRFHHIPVPQVVAPLAAALKDPDDQLRALAILGLRSIPTPEATEAIITALGDVSPGVRLGALDAISQRQDPRAQAAVREYKAANSAGK